LTVGCALGDREIESVNVFGVENQPSASGPSRGPLPDLEPGFAESSAVGIGSWASCCEVRREIARMSHGVVCFETDSRASSDCGNPGLSS